MDPKKKPEASDLAAEIVKALREAAKPEYNPHDDVRLEEAKAARLRGDSYKAKKIANDKQTYEIEIESNGSQAIAGLVVEPGVSRHVVRPDQLEELEKAVPTAREFEELERAKKYAGKSKSLEAAYYEIAMREDDIRTSLSPIRSVKIL